MACGFCHNALSPLNPPADPEHPEWRNIVSAFGNQYFEEGKFFSLNLKPDDFRWHVGNRQPPGTSDTSRVATDHIFNPNAINSIFSLGDRPFHAEKMSDGSVREVHHILKDGADSIGVAGASLRVYVNIGMCSDYWLSLHDPVEGKGTQKPFLIEKARAECADWRATEERMPAAEAFLKTLKPMYLKDAPGGGYYLTKDSELLRRGKIVFGEQCARCHSSKRPPSQIAPGSAEALEWYRQSALADDFLTGNFLSDDERYSVAEVGTNISRAAGSNAVRGHVWDNFSSETYKDLPGPGVLRNLYNPLKPSDPISFNMEAGGRGYYRTPTLISAWATAPFFHNNALGVFLKNPRLRAAWPLSRTRWRNCCGLRRGSGSSRFSSRLQRARSHGAMAVSWRFHRVCRSNSLRASIRTVFFSWVRGVTGLRVCWGNFLAAKFFGTSCSETISLRTLLKTAGIRSVPICPTTISAL